MKFLYFDGYLILNPIVIDLKKKKLRDPLYSPLTTDGHLPWKNSAPACTNQMFLYNALSTIAKILHDLTSHILFYESDTIYENNSFVWKFDYVVIAP